MKARLWIGLLGIVALAAAVLVIVLLEGRSDLKDVARAASEPATSEVSVELHTPEAVQERQLTEREAVEAPRVVEDRTPPSKPQAVPEDAKVQVTVLAQETALPVKGVTLSVLPFNDSLL